MKDVTKLLSLKYPVNHEIVDEASEEKFASSDNKKSSLNSCESKSP